MLVVSARPPYFDLRDQRAGLPFNQRCQTHGEEGTFHRPSPKKVHPLQKQEARAVTNGGGGVSDVELTTSQRGAWPTNQRALNG